MNWFPVDKQVRNDWRIKAVKRRFGIEGVGRLFELWSFVASEGSQTDEGRGVQRDGRPLDLHGMADDCDFESIDALRVFLDYLGEIGHIDADTWQTQGIVFLPAMNRRLEAYRLSKGRGTVAGQMKRGPGRPRKTPENNSGNKRTPTRGFRANIPKTPRIIPGDPAETLENRADLKTPGNSGEFRETPGNSGQTNVPLHCTDLFGSDPKKEPQKILASEKVKIPTPRQLIELWNRLRKPGPRCLDLTKQRAERFRNALKARPDPKDWEAAILYLNAAPWANALGTGNNPTWRADLDYLARPGNVLKAMERIAAANLPGAKVGAAAGRVSSFPGKYEAAEAAQKDNP